MNVNSIDGHNNELNLKGVPGSQDIGKITDTSIRIIGVLELVDQEQLLNSQDRINELISDLELEISNVSKQIGYNYDTDNYLLRLSQNETVFNNTLSQLLNTFPELDSAYQKIIQLVSSLPNSQLILNLIIKKYFSSLVYDFMGNDLGEENKINIKDLFEIVNTSDKTIDYEELRDCIYLYSINFVELDEYNFNLFFYNNIPGMLYFMNKLYEFGVRNIDFNISTLYTILNDDLDKLFNVINSIGSIGFASIDLYFGKSLLPLMSSNNTNFNNLISQFGNNGTKHLQLSHFDFNEIFYGNQYLPNDFVKIVGLSLIKSLSIFYGTLNNYYKDNPSGLIDFIRIAGESGIKNLSFCEVKLPDLIGGNKSILGDAFKVAGESGIVNFSLVLLELDEFLTFNEDIFIDSINIAGESGIKVLDFGNKIKENIKKSQHSFKIEKAIENCMKQHGIIIKHY